MKRPSSSRATRSGLLVWSVRLHKWISLAVGLQVLFWVLGGLVMTVLSIGVVRGEHHAPPAPDRPLPVAHVVALGEAVRVAGIAPTQAELRQTPRGTVWILTGSKGDPIVVDATTPGRLRPFSAAEALQFARRGYKGPAAPVSARLLETAPQETGKVGPLWRVDFNDVERTSLYLSPTTGEVVSRRSNVWRFYDLFWRLHIMDWPNGEDFNNPLVIAAAALAFVLVITGFDLLYWRLIRGRQSSRRTPASTGPRLAE